MASLWFVVVQNFNSTTFMLSCHDVYELILLQINVCSLKHCCRNQHLKFVLSMSNKQVATSCQILPTKVQ